MLSLLISILLSVQSVDTLVSTASEDPCCVAGGPASGQGSGTRFRDSAKPPQHRGSGRGEEQGA
jgi:hypothetical protein